MKRIIFNLKHEWYDKIACGEKTVEYRNICLHWASRLHVTYIPISKLDNYVLIDNKRDIPHDWFAVFRLGYSRKHPDIVRRIVKIDIGQCPYDGWDGDYFRIHFEKGVAK